MINITDIQGLASEDQTPFIREDGEEQLDRPFGHHPEMDKLAERDRIIARMSERIRELEAGVRLWQQNCNQIAARLLGDG